MARPALLTRPHVELLEVHSDQVESYGDLLEEVMQDGKVDAREQRLLVLRFDTVQTGSNAALESGERVHESLTFASRAMQGAGVFGAWFEQRAREFDRDRKHLRVVVDNTDPEPDGPVAQRKRAA